MTRARKISRVAIEARTVLTRYPGVAAATMTEWIDLVQGARIMESLLATAADHTADPEEQVDIAVAVFSFVMIASWSSGR